VGLQRLTYHYLAVAAMEAENGRDDWSVVMFIVHSSSSSVSASSIVADIRDWSPEQLLRRNAATAAIDVDRSSSPEAVKRLPANKMPCQLITSRLGLVWSASISQYCLVWLGSVTVRKLDSWSWGRGFNSKLGRYQVINTWMGGCLQTNKPSRYITNTKVNSAFDPPGVSKSSTSLLGWG